MEKLIGTKSELIKQILDLKFEDNDFLKAEITRIKDKKTLQQNRYMWELIHQIAQKQNQDEMEVYCQALQQANAKYTWLEGLPEIKEKLLQVYRAVQITRYEERFGKQFAIFKCYEGTSKYDKQEMMELLEIIIGWAEELDIPTIRDFG
jgi:hypothetical protein